MTDRRRSYAGAGGGGGAGTNGTPTVSTAARAALNRATFPGTLAAGSAGACAGAMAGREIHRPRQIFPARVAVGRIGSKRHGGRRGRNRRARCGRWRRWRKRRRTAEFWRAVRAARAGWRGTDHFLFLMAGHISQPGASGGGGSTDIQRFTAAGAHVGQSQPVRNWCARFCLRAAAVAVLVHCAL